MSTTRRDGGINRQPDGSWRVRVCVGSRGHTHTRSKRFPAGTTMRVMRDWRVKAEAALLDALPATVYGGTFAADVADYVATLPASARPYAENCLGMWLEPFGPRDTLSLTAQDIARHLAELRRRGYSPSSCNKYRAKLSVLFKWRYPDDPNPVTVTARYAQPKSAAPTLTIEDVRAMIDTISPCPAKRTLRVFSETGMPYARIRRVRPDHLRLTGPEPAVYLVPRLKGAGTAGGWFPLTARGAEAWRELARYQYEVPNTPALRRAWHGACRRTGRPEVKPYVLRYAIAAELLRACNGNVFAVAALLDVTLATAQHYSRAAVPDAVRALIGAMNVASGQP